MDNIQELREAVNPVFNTAKSCVQLLAAAGDEDSQRLIDALGFESFGTQVSSKAISEEMVKQFVALLPVFECTNETRFTTMNQLIASEPSKCVVDLPCGYTSRGIKMSRQGRPYFGFDLPAVIEDLVPAVKSIIGDVDNINYQAVDATNYTSLEKGLSKAKTDQELLITTEGLLMYFTQPELETVFSNIRRILSNYGGSWVIADRAYHLHNTDVNAAVLENDPRKVAIVTAIITQSVNNTADMEASTNVFFDEDDEKVKAFITDMGFELKEICMADYLPSQLHSLDTIPEAEDGVRNVFKNMYFWVLSVSKTDKEYHHADKTFSVDGRLQDSILHISLSGRLDTLTAPDLLSLYQGIDQNTIKGIDIDFENLDYISSAGLRVLLIMYKAHSDSFNLTGISTEVMDIFETTGFASIFGL